MLHLLKPKSLTFSEDLKIDFRGHPAIQHGNQLIVHFAISILPKWVNYT